MADLNKAAQELSAATLARIEAEKDLQDGERRLLDPLREAVKAAEVTERQARESFDRAVLDARKTQARS